MRVKDCHDASICAQVTGPRIVNPTEVGCSVGSSGFFPWSSSCSDNVRILLAGEGNCESAHADSSWGEAVTHVHMLVLLLEWVSGVGMLGPFRAAWDRKQSMQGKFAMIRQLLCVRQFYVDLGF
jgi:hypothetical protein